MVNKKLMNDNSSVIIEDAMSGDPTDRQTGASGEQNYNTQAYTNLEIVGETNDEPNLDSYLTGDLSRQ